MPLLTITVNGVPHQQAIPADARLQWEPQYGLPYERANAGKAPKNVLIIGAGSGSDVAIALKKGAEHVDAVEIDPRIRDIGKARHPDRPYQDPRVTSHIDDGRAFLSRTDKKYDLILLALPDSLTLVNGASSLRLESYLFTQQAFESARDHLNPGGAFAMYNYYRETWLIDRLASTARAGVRAQALRGQGRRRSAAGGRHGRPDRARPDLRRRVARGDRDHAAAGDGQPAVPVPVHRPDPVAVPGHARADPASPV